jgi:hypothetical protein
MLRLQLMALLLVCQQVVFGQNTPKSPDQYLPHAMGVQFTPHHMLTDYFNYLAAQAPQTMRLEQYGTTNQGRPLKIAVFSSPENINRLESIRLNNLRMAGLADGQPATRTNMPAIIWIGMTVHGNEPSGAECSMTLAWQLATQTDTEVREWLRNAVVILDPSCNPDGYERYVNWYRGVSNLIPNVHPISREHNEPWPGGRPNHYLHDLNRDWAWATQVESRQRLALYHKWLPHVHADLHEMYFDEPYYFAPAAEPSHAYLTDWQRSFQGEVGRNNARYFDQNGWLYFTKEVFDLFYPSYGDTYPLFNGAIGMTYEQAGHSRAGRAILIEGGDTLRLTDRAMHHLVASRSTIEVSSKNAAQLVENFQKFYADAASKPPGEHATYIIKASSNPNTVRAFCQLLDRHQIKYGLAGASTPVRGYDYRSNQEISTTVEANDLIISAYQPHGVMAQVLLEPQHTLVDSLTYDITAWSLIQAYGFDAVATKQRIEPKKNYEPYQAPSMMIAAVPYAWCFERGSMAALQCIGELCQKGVRIRYGTEPFTLGNKSFGAGSIVINRADNKHIANELDGWVRDAGARANVQLYPVMSGMAAKGNDLGSAKYLNLPVPKVAVVYGDDVEANSYGHVWYYFEQELKYPVTMIHLDQLSAQALSEFNVLVIPNGGYNFNDQKIETLSAFANRGGRIVAFEGGVRAFVGEDGFDLRLKPDLRRDASNKPKPYQASERAAISDQIPGAVCKAQIDQTHPLTYGLGSTYYSLKTSSEAYEMPNSGTSTALWLGDTYEQFGFIGSHVKPRLKNTPIATLQPMGNGSVVFMVDNPLFRSFWHQGKILFGNALFF